MKIQVENIKCNGCVATITKELLSIKGTSDVKIELETQTINVVGAEELRPKIISKLRKLGYPEQGENNLLEKAKSYVSCAIGKMS
jgi:copper chaperone